MSLNVGPSLELTLFSLLLISYFHTDVEAFPHLTMVELSLYIKSYNYVLLVSSSKTPIKEVFFLENTKFPQPILPFSKESANHAVQSFLLVTYFVQGGGDKNESDKCCNACFSIICIKFLISPG